MTNSPAVASPALPTSKVELPSTVNWETGPNAWLSAAPGTATESNTTAAPFSAVTCAPSRLGPLPRSTSDPASVAVIEAPSTSSELARNCPPAATVMVPVTTPPVTPVSAPFRLSWPFSYSVPATSRPVSETVPEGAAAPLMVSAPTWSLPPASTETIEAPPIPPSISAESFTPGTAAAGSMFVVVSFHWTVSSQPPAGLELEGLGVQMKLSPAMIYLQNQTPSPGKILIHQSKL